MTFIFYERKSAKIDKLVPLVLPKKKGWPNVVCTDMLYYGVWVCLLAHGPIYGGGLISGYRPMGLYARNYGRPRCNMPETLPKMLLGNSPKPCRKCSQTLPKILGKCSLFCHPQHTPSKPGNQKILNKRLARGCHGKQFINYSTRS